MKRFFLTTLIIVDNCRNRLLCLVDWWSDEILNCSMDALRRIEDGLCVGGGFVTRMRSRLCSFDDLSFGRSYGDEVFVVLMHGSWSGPGRCRSVSGVFVPGGDDCGDFTTRVSLVVEV